MWSFIDKDHYSAHLQIYNIFKVSNYFLINQKCKNALNFVLGSNLIKEKSKFKKKSLKIKLKNMLSCFALMFYPYNVHF